MVQVKDDLTGRCFGRLKVISRSEDYISPKGVKQTQWLCECSCDNHNRIVVRRSNLISGITQSCGCRKREINSDVHKKSNKKDLSGEYGIIWSTNTNEEIYFDLEDSDKILQYSWYISDTGYPKALINGKHIKMHIYLGYKWYDHRNRNKLDNRKENFRKCTHQENNRNSSKSANNTSGFIGVTWNNRDKRWIAQICIDYKTIPLARCVNKEDAIKARLEAEAKYFGDFAPQRHLFEQYGVITEL